MKPILKYFNHMCERKYKPHGFSRKKAVFARIRGDIIQAFTLKRFQDVPICTVEFGIFPLCLPQPIYLEAGGYELDAFSVEQRLSHSGWIFDRGSNQSMVACIDLISEAIDLYLLPFFDKCHDCKSAFEELIKLEEEFESVRQRVLYLAGETDHALPLQERSLFDSRKYYMALKAHNYSYAQRYLKHQVEHYESRLKKCNAPDATIRPEIVKKRFADARDRYTELLERLDSGDLTYFENLINFNENQTREFIAAQYPKIQL